MGQMELMDVWIIGDMVMFFRMRKVSIPKGSIKSGAIVASCKISGFQFQFQKVRLKGRLTFAAEKRVGGFQFQKVRLKECHLGKCHESNGHFNSKRFD